MPPLRERVEDIPLLAAHFLEHFAGKNHKSVKGFTPTAMDFLLKHVWPGNVRELENVVERAVVLLVGEYISERELPTLVLGGPARAGDAARPVSLAGLSLDEVEKRAVLETLASCAGNKSEAARRRGGTRKTLHAKLARYGLAGREDETAGVEENSDLQ